MITTVQVYDPFTKKWTKQTPTFPTVAQEAGACDMLYGIAFLVGGYDINGNVLGTNDQYYVSPTIP